jgi:hypothetical protein
MRQFMPTLNVLREFAQSFLGLVRLLPRHGRHEEYWLSSIDCRSYRIRQWLHLQESQIHLYV